MHCLRPSDLVGYYYLQPSILFNITVVYVFFDIAVIHMGHTCKVSHSAAKLAAFRLLGGSKPIKKILGENMPTLNRSPLCALKQ